MLDLSDNAIEDNAVLALADGLRELRGLTQLSLSGNHMEDAGASALVSCGLGGVDLGPIALVSWDHGRMWRWLDPHFPLTR